MSESEKKKRWKLILNIITFGALILLVYLTWPQITETISNIGRVNTWALLMMIPLQVMNYDAYARMYRAMFAIIGSKTRYWDMYRTALELNFVNHVFPSGGVSGISYFSVRLKPLGISTAQSTLVQIMKFAFLFLSFEILLVIALLSLAVFGEVSGLTLVIGASLVTLLAVMTAGLAFIVGSKQRINRFFTYATKAVNRVIHVIRPKHPETINIKRVRRVFTELHENYKLLKKDYRSLRAPLYYGLIANITEVLTVYSVYLAFGHTVNIGAIILAYAVANFAGLVSVLPGGVGIYEALMTAVLAAAGVPPGVSIPVTVMYRVISMAIQTIPGYYFYHKAPTFDSPDKG
ncbi:flippase-like domain-containing protein [Candidatus Saccharibacteria bacterium]|nr:flippase-like domain-containing protein [Candidatus Saccharibacteria bacterium]